MSKKSDLPTTRFRLNMDRIAGLMKLALSKDDSLKPAGLFQADGVRADVLRAVVVFLHATFEDVLRSHQPKPNQTNSIYSAGDIDRALKRSGIDAKPFKPLYPPLTQIAKRRNRIVHNADLPSSGHTVLEDWGIVDYWELPMWNLAVLAFYYQLLISTNMAGEVERKMLQNLWAAMASHANFGHQLISFSGVSPELQSEALLKMADTLEKTRDLLQLK